jgi:hypothetical protein
MGGHLDRRNEPMKRKHTPPACYAAKAVYIDPTACDSVIGYRYYTYGGNRTSKSIDVKLTDCSKEINWGFSWSIKRERSLALRKVQRAIAVLREVENLILTAKIVKPQPKTKPIGAQL